MDKTIVEYSTIIFKLNTLTAITFTGIINIIILTDNIFLVQLSFETHKSNFIRLPLELI